MMKSKNNMDIKLLITGLIVISKSNTPSQLAMQYQGNLD